MSNNEEKLLILKMIEEGKVTSAEGLELLDAVESKSSQMKSTSNAKWLKIRISEGDKAKVNVNIPVSLIDIGLKLADKMSPEMKDMDLNNIDFDEIIEAVKNGAEGKLVDIYDEEENQKIEIYVD